MSICALACGEGPGRFWTHPPITAEARLGPGCADLCVCCQRVPRRRLGFLHVLVESSGPGTRGSDTHDGTRASTPQPTAAPSPRRASCLPWEAVKGRWNYNSTGNAGSPDSFRPSRVTMTSQSGGHRRPLCFMKTQENKRPPYTGAGLCLLRVTPAPHHSLPWTAAGVPAALPLPHL